MLLGNNHQPSCFHSAILVTCPKNKATLMSPFPLFLPVCQNFPETPLLDIAATIAGKFSAIRARIKPGKRIAVGVGSRGITNLSEIVRATLDQIRSAGGQPFLIPAMGSHGGATPPGQREVLASYGLTEEAMGVPIHASMEVKQVGTSEQGVPVHCSIEALAADGIVLINRIKPHTDFTGTLGSGLLKMAVIGLGKRIGATAMHVAASRIGHEEAIRGMARVLLRTTPILGGVAILENQRHETAGLTVLLGEDFEERENALLAEARRLMPLLPFEEIDLLIVDQLGKNISGAGMDPNVINRSIHGYSSSLLREGQPAPFIRRIFVRGLTPETHGNAIGVGLADVTTTRLVQSMDQRATFINALTALTPQSAKAPIHFDTDRECLERAIDSLALDDPSTARIAWIRDTLSLAEMKISEPLWRVVQTQGGLTAAGEARELVFDGEGNLSN